MLDQLTTAEYFETIPYGSAEMREYSKPMVNRWADQMQYFEPLDVGSAEWREYSAPVDAGSAEQGKIFWNHALWISWGGRNILSPWSMAELTRGKYFELVDVGSAEQREIFCTTGCWISWDGRNIPNPWSMDELTRGIYFEPADDGSAEQREIFWSCGCLDQLIMAEYFETMPYGSAEMGEIFWTLGQWMSWPEGNILHLWMLDQLTKQNIQKPCPMDQLRWEKYSKPMVNGWADQRQIFWTCRLWISWTEGNILILWMLD